MNTLDYCYGFRVLGSAMEPRRLIDWSAAFAAYAACDERAEVAKESYLSAFIFAEDFSEYMKANGTTKGFAGSCWTPWVPFDIDREQIADALIDSRKLAAAIVELLGIDESDILAFYSGAKGFHLLVPTCLWTPVPGPTFHKVARRFAERIAERAGVVIDTGIYDRVRLFRAPNSKHPKTGRHKRHLTSRELMGMTPEAIERMAETPERFDPPMPTYKSNVAANAWQEAAAAVQQESEAKSARHAAGNGTVTLNRNTLQFIRDGADTGDRHRLTYSAAANLAELGAPLPLCLALLTDAALDCGLPPSDARRAIENGWASTQPKGAA